MVSKIVLGCDVCGESAVTWALRRGGETPVQIDLCEEHESDLVNIQAMSSRTVQNDSVVFRGLTDDRLLAIHVAD